VKFLFIFILIDKDMPTLELIVSTGQTYFVDVPPLAPLFAAADILCREVLLPAEHMIFHTLEGERVSKYIAVVEDMRLRVSLRNGVGKKGKSEV
jgi:hypothetical protein